MRRPFRALELAEQLAIECITIADELPQSQSRLADQLRRASSSAALNLAEGSARTSYRDYCRFLDTTVASFRETELALRILHATAHMTDSRYAQVESLRDEATRTTYGVLRAIKRKVEAGETRRAI